MIIATRDDPAWNAALGLAWLSPFGHHLLLKQIRGHGLEAIWGADRGQLRAWGMRERTIDGFLDRRAGYVAEEARAALEAGGLRFVAYGRPGFPPELVQLGNPPAGLFIQGSEESWERLLALPRVTIVGTRRTTPLGVRATEAFAGAFSAAGVAVVSGMAAGVDAWAHRAALATEGLTAAVLGCGADVVYPPANRWLHDKIRAAGVIISELPPGAPPASWTFPHRNRLLAALGDAVLVTEAPSSSGALQTVDSALELGRPVFVVPGSIFADGYRGCNRLLSEGASPALEPCVTVEDFFLQARIERGHRLLERRCTASEPGNRDGSLRLPSRNDRVWTALREGPTAADLLVERTGLPAREVSAALAELELDGLVRRAGPGIYARGP